MARGCEPAQQVQLHWTVQAAVTVVVCPHLGVEQVQRGRGAEMDSGAAARGAHREGAAGPGAALGSERASGEGP